MTDLPYHPAANLFPMMSEEQFQQLKADIKENGQQEPATSWKDRLIDGRNRLRACSELGIEPDIEELMDELDPVAYVISRNLHRRHLTTNQRACVAAKLATLKNGGDRQSEEFSSSNDLLNQADAATLLSVSVPALKRAKRVIETASSAVVEAVESDQIKASLACKFIGLCEGKRDQAKIVKEGVKAVREYVKERTPSKASKPPQAASQSNGDEIVTPPTKVEEPAASDSDDLELTGVKPARMATEDFLNQQPLSTLCEAIRSIDGDDHTKAEKVIALARELDPGVVIPTPVTETDDDDLLWIRLTDFVCNMDILGGFTEQITHGFTTEIAESAVKVGVSDIRASAKAKVKLDDYRRKFFAYLNDPDRPAEAHTSN